MIVASNGMLTSGRVIGHLGYQGVGTLGASLQAGARTAKTDGQIVEVRCQVRSISGFSAHADEPQLLAWLRNFVSGRAPQRVFLVHGEPDAQAATNPKIQGSDSRRRFPAGGSTLPWTEEPAAIGREPIKSWTKPKLRKPRRATREASLALRSAKSRDVESSYTPVAAPTSGQNSLASPGRSTVTSRPGARRNPSLAKASPASIEPHPQRPVRKPGT
jgi:hypothetical protein